MTQTISNYARVLYELSVPSDMIHEAAHLLRENEALLRVLRSPVILLREKERTIDRIFPKELRGFMKAVCKNGRAGAVFSVFDAYEEYAGEQKGVLKAEIAYVTPPDNGQLEQIKTYLCNKYQKADVVFELREDASLLGGFTLRAGSFEYDYSLRGRYRRLEEKLIRR